MKIESVSGVTIKGLENSQDPFLFRKIIQDLKETLPSVCFRNLDYIVLGEFSYGKQKDYKAFYVDKKIYIDSSSKVNEELKSTITHEFAHHLENTIPELIYEDSELVNEFKDKRQTLQNKLRKTNKKPNLDFDNIHYNQELDYYFYEELGYDFLSRFTYNLFSSPYSATSIREYFAIGFEIYFTKNNSNDILFQTCPKLEQKLMELSKL